MNFEILNKTICLTAKRGSGKSRLLRYLVIMNKHIFDKIFIVCPTECLNSFYKGIVPPENIFDTFKEEWFEKLIKRMTEVNSGKTDDEMKHILVILDDCASDVAFHHSKAIKKLFTRGRHLKISIIMTAQYIYHISPLMRCNTDFLLVGQMNKQGVDILATEFLMGNLTKQEFIQMYYNSTNDYKFLLINNNSTKSNDDLNEIYGKLKCPERYVK